MVGGTLKILMHLYNSCVKGHSYLRESSYGARNVAVNSGAKKFVLAAFLLHLSLQREQDTSRKGIFPPPLSQGFPTVIISSSLSTL